MKQSNDKFNFFIPADFSKAGEKGEMSIEGICSSNTEDSDGEYLDPTGFDFQPLLDKGFFNWNHQASKDASTILGRPTEAKVINGGKDFHVKGYLYKGSKQARDVYDLAKTLEAEDPTRRLGFSIEGQAIERDPINPKRIRRARITGVAITHCPKNANTLLSIMKGEYADSFIEEEREEIKTCPQCDHDQLVKGTCLSCGFVEKAMGVNIEINPESVEGKPKDQVDADKVNFLTKSQVYNRIFDTYGDDIEKANKIYQLIERTAEKLFNMKTVTEESLTKAFDILESTTSLVKSEEGKNAEEVAAAAAAPEPTEEELKKSEEEGEMKKKEEQLSKARECIEGGMNKGEALDEMQKSGGWPMVECQGAVETVIREMEAAKEGGNITKSFEVLQESLVSKITDTLEKSNAGIGNQLQTLAAGLDAKFGAVAEILKSQSETNAENLDTITKSLEGVSDLVEKIAKEPFPKKSATNITAIEKFQKSADGKSDNFAYELSKSEDRAALGDRLMVKATELRAAGHPNDNLEKAIANLEITKSLDAAIIPFIENMGINVVK